MGCKHSKICLGRCVRRRDGDSKSPAPETSVAYDAGAASIETSVHLDLEVNVQLNDDVAVDFSALNLARTCDSVSWTDPATLKWCHGGSGGAYIVSFADQKVCVKGSPCLPAELFASLLSDRLGVRVARVRAVRQPEEVAAVRGCLMSAEPEEESDGLKAAQYASSLVTSSTVEYVDGVPMMGLAAHELIKSKASNDALWQQLGRLMAFDMLINNFDRLPLAWSNDGNLGNVMIHRNGDALIGIDQAINPILNAQGLERYLQRLADVTWKMRTDVKSALASVKTAIWNNVAVELSERQMEAIQQGCLSFAQAMKTMLESGTFHDHLQAVAAEVVEVFQQQRELFLGDPDSLCKTYCEMVQCSLASVLKGLDCAH
jgi:hypothetical protein